MRTRRIDPNRYADPGLLRGIVRQVRLTWRLLNDPRVPTALKVIVPALVVIYAVSPLDVLPDVLLGLGQLDDVGILLAALALFARLAPAAVVAEHEATIDGRPVEREPATEGQGRVFEAEYTVGGTGRGAAKH